MSYCPQCGHQLSQSNSKFCPKCGYNLTKSPIKDSEAICPECNAIISDEHADCPNCGCPSDKFIKLKYNATSKKKSSSTRNVMIVLCALLILGVSGYFLLNKSHDKSDKQSSSFNTNNYKTTKSIEDYDDLLRQIKVCERKKQIFEDEVDKIPYKMSSPYYQGIMAQKIFLDANNALDDFNKECVKLERLLKKYGFDDMAAKHKRDRENLDEIYREEKRRAQGFR